MSGEATHILVDTIGWIAAGLILGGYILLSLGKLDGRSRTYQWMNVVGAAGFIANSGYYGAIPSAALNVVWMAMGMYTLWRVQRGAAETVPRA